MLRLYVQSLRKSAANAREQCEFILVSIRVVYPRNSRLNTAVLRRLMVSHSIGVDRPINQLLSGL